MSKSQTQSPAVDKRAAKPGRYWLVSTSPENFEKDRSELGFHVQGLKHRHRKQMQKFRPGDLVVYYINKVVRFGAIARITGTYYDDRSRLWTEEDELWPSRAPSEPVLVLDQETMLDVRKIKDDLTFVSKYPKDRWQLAFQGSIREIPEDDFKLIESEMRKLPHGEYLLPSVAPVPPVPSKIVTEGECEKAIGALPLNASTLHDRLGEMLQAVGTWMGYNATTRQKITPEHVHELDVAWLKGKNPQVAVEIQIGGDIDKALKKLAEAKKFNFRKVLLVVKEDQMRLLNDLIKMDEIRHWLDVWSIGSVYELYNDGSRFFELYGKVEESRYKDQKALELI